MCIMYALDWVFILGIRRNMERSRNALAQGSIIPHPLDSFFPNIFIRSFQHSSSLVLVYFLSFRFATAFNASLGVDCIKTRFFIC